MPGAAASRGAGASASVSPTSASSGSTDTVPAIGSRRAIVRRTRSAMTSGAPRSATVMPQAVRTQSASGRRLRPSPYGMHLPQSTRLPSISATKRASSLISRVLPTPASPVTTAVAGSPPSMTSSMRPISTPRSASRPMNGASSPRPGRAELCARRRTSSYADTGSRFPLSRIGCSARHDAMFMVASAVSRPAQTAPEPATSDNRAAVFTVSPTTVYSRAAWTPATTSPVFSPTRSPSGAPPPRSSSSTRRTARCIDSAARTARSASSSCATGAPKTAMMPSPVSLSTCPPTSVTASESAVSTRPVTTLTRSGSSSSAHAVKSVRSPNSTVTTRRSVPGSRTRSASIRSSDVPQLKQNRAPGIAGVPQAGQANAVPDGAVIRGRRGSRAARAPRALRRARGSGRRRRRHARRQPAAR